MSNAFNAHAIISPAMIEAMLKIKKTVNQKAAVAIVIDQNIAGRISRRALHQHFIALPKRRIHADTVYRYGKWLSLKAAK